MRFVVQGLLVVIAVLCVGTVLAQEAQTPNVEGFQLSGEQWSCTADGNRLMRDWFTKFGVLSSAAASI